MPLGADLGGGLGLVVVVVVVAAGGGIMSLLCVFWPGLQQKTMVSKGG